MKNTIDVMRHMFGERIEVKNKEGHVIVLKRYKRGSKFLWKGKVAFDPSEKKHVEKAILLNHSLNNNIHLKICDSYIYITAKDVKENEDEILYNIGEIPIFVGRFAAIETKLKNKIFTFEDDNTEGEDAYDL